MCMLCRSLFVLLSLFFWPLCCLSFLILQILIIPYLQILLELAKCYVAAVTFLLKFLFLVTTAILNGGLGSEIQFWKGITQGPSQHTFVVWFHLGVNATFNNISAISWHSALFGGYRSTRRKRPTCHNSLTNFITSICIKYILPWVGFELITSVVIVTDSIGSCTFVNPNKNYDCKHSEQEQNKLRDINYNKWKQTITAFIPPPPMDAIF